MTDDTRTATRSRQNTRTRLMDAAVEVFGEVGLDAASVEAICERAGFTRGAFYSNFDTKDELFLAIIARETESKLEAVAERVRGLQVRSFGDPVALVEEVLGASFHDAMPPGLLNELRTQAFRDERTAIAYLAWQDGMIARVERIIAGVVDAHGLRLRMPVPQLARLFVEVSDDTIARAVLERLGQRETTRLLNERLGMVAAALIDPPD